MFEHWPPNGGIGPVEIDPYYLSKMAAIQSATGTTLAITTTTVPVDFQTISALTAQESVTKRPSTTTARPINLQRVRHAE